MEFTFKFPADENTRFTPQAFDHAILQEMKLNVRVGDQIVEGTLVAAQSINHGTEMLMTVDVPDVEVKLWRDVGGLLTGFSAGKERDEGNH